MAETVEDVFAAFLGFVNEQVGVYIDVLAAFDGHYLETKLQVARVSRPANNSKGPDGMDVITWRSYEDPARPEVVHTRIVRASDVFLENAAGGSNEQRHARSVLVFIYTYWEEEIRPRLAKARGVPVGEVASELFGDLRRLRIAILHTRSILGGDAYAKLKILGAYFTPDLPLDLRHPTMDEIFKALQRDAARILFDWLGVSEMPFDLDTARGFTIKRAAPRMAMPPRWHCHNWDRYVWAARPSQSRSRASAAWVLPR